MARNSTERLGGEYGLESRGSALSYTAAVGDNISTPQASVNVVLCWFYWGDVSCVTFP